MSVDIGDGIGVNMTENDPQLELELYFLIAKFLSNGPCQNAYKILRAEMAKNKLLPKRVDWSGQEHFRTYGNLVSTHGHISSNHLKDLCKRLLTLVENNSGSCPKGLKSLLGAGQFSVLRTEETCKHTIWKSSSYLVRRNGHPIRPPHNLLHPPNITTILKSREMIGSARMDLILSGQFYGKMNLLFRSLGHLSSVYCVLFDRTGNYIITGSDDNLVKVWSAISGRLLCTLRGHAAEINDMAVNFSNRLLAVGSCDKLIRVWCLKTSAPVAILHGHTHMITSLRFSPYTKGTTNYLASTGGDGCLCVWEYNIKTNVFNPKPIKFVEKSRAGAQMLCLSFSAGGGFVATGSLDNVVRVYSLGGRVPEKICELESHNDRIDSVQYSNSDLRFVTGSKDGYARIWRYERQEWKAIVLSMADSETSTSKNDDSGDWSLPQRKVTMVCWTVDDAFVVTAVSDFTIKVWNSSTGQLCHTLKGHANEVFVLEPNPVDRRILLSAGHDGNIFFWDVITGQKVRTFKNTIEGQGFVSVFDCKWSPDGQSFAATDSLGYLLYFGFGSNDKYKKLPEEIYFHTDYRPLMRDAHNNVLDEQTQVPPHMLPPPFLVDIDGNPHSPKYQRLVPGREDCNDTQLVPLVVVAPNGNREVLDDLTGELRAADEEIQLAGVLEQSANENPEDRPIIDEMIARMQQVQDMQLMREGNGQTEPPTSTNRISTRSSNTNHNDTNRSGPSSGNVSQGPLSPPLTNQSRSQASGSASTSQQASDTAPQPEAPPSPGQENQQLPINMCIWKQRDLVKQLDEQAIKNFFDGKVVQSEEERANFLAERKKKPIQAIIQRLEDTNDMTSHARTRMMKQKRSRMLSMDRNEERGRNRLERRALYDTDESDQEGSMVMSEDEEEEDVTREYSFMENSKNQDSSDDSASTVYSDWSPGRTQHPPTRQSQRHKKNTRASIWNESGSEEDTEVEEESPEVKKSKVKVNGVSKGKSKNSKNVGKRRSMESVADENSNDATEMDGEEGKKESKMPKGKIVLVKKPTTRHGPHVHPQIHGEVREVPQEFRPPEWLTSSIPHKTPYFPQVGDEVIYFFQGHQQYVEAVKSTGAYQIDPARTVLPWVKLPQIREQELMKVIAIKYEIKPPRLVCLKLAFIDPETSRMTGGSVTIKYHDMVGVIDFVVLRHTYNVAMERNWNPGDNFRCLIDDTWWHGAILSHEPFHPDYPDSMFQCYVVQWDNGEQERLSPWDFEPVDDSRLPETPGGNVPVTREELMSMRYPVNHKPHDWPHLRCEEECDRIVEGLERIMDLSIAEPFLVPVDLNAFPIYAMVIEYPIDLSLIKERLLNRFYRRLAAVQYDIRHIETNARVFNEPSSQIVKSAKIVTDLCLAFVSDPNCYDPMPIYNLMTQRSEQGRNASRTDNEEDTFNQEPGENSFHDAVRRKTRHARISERLRLNGANNRNNWREQCLKLLDLIVRCPDSLPFQHPVDVSEFPDYLQIVHQPMDLSTIRNNLESDLYDNPNEFCRDVRLIFTNSRAYNTNRRSKIYVMTLRLLAMFEEQLKITLKGIKESKKESSGKTAAHLKAFSSFKKSGHSNANSSTRTVGSSSFNALNGSAFDTSGNSGQHDNSSTALQGGAHSSSQQNRGAKRRRIESDEEEEDDDDDDDDEDEEEEEELEQDSLVSPDQRERMLRSGAKSSKGEKSGRQNDHQSSNNNRHQSKRPKFYDEDDEDDVPAPNAAVKKPKKSSSERKRNSHCIYKDDLEDEIEDEEEDDDGDQTSDVDFRISSYRRKGQRSKGERAKEKKRKKNKKNKKDKSKKKIRKNPYYEDDDEEEDEDDEEEEEEDEDDVEINYRIKGSSNKRKRAPSRRPDSRNDGYGTRCSTGSIKRRRYDKEYEEDVLNKSINNGMVHHYEDDYEDASKRSLRSRPGQIRDQVLTTHGPSHSHSTGDVLMIRLSRNGVEQALSASRHQLNSHNKTKTDAIDENAKNSSASDSEETDEEAKEDLVEAPPAKNNNMASSYTSGSTEKNEATDDDEDDDTEDESDGSDTETYSNRSGPSNNRLRTPAERPDHQAHRPAKVRSRKSNSSPKVGYRTRNQGRRTIQYTEQDDEEDDGTGDKSAVGVSSRGRPQRPNVRLTSMVRH